MDKKKILIVEDERIIAEDLKRTLTRLGYEITGIASSSKVALEMAEVNIPDLVVMDIMLRGKTDGITIAKKLNDRFEIPSIYLTAYADKTILKRAKITAPYGYIMKPFDEKELHINVEIALERSRTDRLIRRTNAVLRTVRDINQLIVRGHDHQVLIKEACKILTREKVYPRSWIVLLDKEGKLTHSAQSGWGKKFQSLKNMLKEGKTPVCGERALLQKEIILSKGSEHCHNCPFQNYYPKYNNLTIALRSRGETFGLMSVALTDRIAVDKVEMDLVKELAEDIAFALYDMGLEEKMKVSEKKYRTLTESAQESIFVIGRDDRVEYVNTFGAAQFGLRTNDVEGKLRSSLFPPEIAKEQSKTLKKVFKTGKEIVTEDIAQFGDRKVWLNNILTPLMDEKGTVSSVMGISRDITERKKAEDLLRESELKYRKLIDNSRLGMALYLKDGRYVFCNKRFSDITGYSEKEVQSPNFDFGELFSREDRKIIRMNSKRRFAGEKIPPYVLPIKIKNGREKFIEINNTLIHFQGQPAVQIQIMDVTKREEAARELAESEEKFRKLVDNSPTGILSIDRTGKINELNRKMLEILGSPSVEATKKINLLTSKPLRKLGLSRQFIKVIETGKKVVMEHEYISRWDKKSFLRYQIVPLGDRNNNIIGAQANFEDITELKNEEKILNLIMEGTSSVTGQDFFRKLVQIISQAMDMEIAFISRKDHAKRGTVKSVAMWLKGEFAHNIEWDVENTPCKRVIAGETVVVCDHVQEKFPKDIWLQDMKVKSYLAVPIVDSDGNVAGHMGVLDRRIITETERLENLLKIFAVRAGAELQRLQAEEEFESVFKSNPLPIMTLDEDRRIQSSNDAAQEYWNITAEDIIGKRPGEVMLCIHHLDSPEGCGFGPDCKNCLTRNTIMDTLHDRKNRQGIEAEMSLIVDGKSHQRIIRLNTSFFDTLSGPRVLVVFDDITEEKRVQNALAESEEKFRAIFESFIDVYYQQDKDRLVTMVSPSVRQFGYEPEDIIGTRGMDYYFNKVDRDAIMEKLEKEGIVKNYEIQLKDSRGNPVWTSVNLRMSQDEKGNFTGIDGVLRNITEKKQSEDALKASEEKYRTIVEASHDLIWTTDRKGKITFMNKNGRKYLGYEDEEILGKDTAKFIRPDHLSTARKHFLKVIHEAKTQSYEVKAIDRYGKELFVLTNQVPIIEENRVVGVMAFGLDITERKKAELELQKKMQDLDRANKLMVGRELKMVDLKREVNELLEKTGLGKKYASPDELE